MDTVLNHAELGTHFVTNVNVVPLGVELNEVHHQRHTDSASEDSPSTDPRGRKETREWILACD